MLQGATTLQPGNLLKICHKCLIIRQVPEFIFLTRCCPECIVPEFQQILFAFLYDVLTKLSIAKYFYYCKCSWIINQLQI